MHQARRRHDRLLPRIRRVLTMLDDLSPASLLDVGTGRGAFLRALLDAFPTLDVTAIDRDEERVAALSTIQRSGFARLSVAQMNATALRFDDETFDGVTLLEVLEHLPDPMIAAREAVRVARRFVVASVPSKPDANPEHLHVFDRATLTTLLELAGARDVSIDEVPGHLIALALVDIVTR